MTKAHLDKMIAALKDRCKESMEAQFNTSCAMRRPCLDAHHVVHPEQMVSISALISYVAHVTGRTEYRIERELSNHFCIPNPKFLPQDQYDAAVRYMVDQVPAGRC